MLFSSWPPVRSSSKHTTPAVVHRMASLSEKGATHVKVESAKEPRRLLRPDNVFGPGLALLSSGCTRPGFDREPGEGSPTRQTLTYLVPTVIRLLLHHAMLRTAAVHLLVKCNLAAPVFALIDQMKRKPSLTSPSVASHCELGLKATQRTPKLCSVRMDRGTSVGAPAEIEKMFTLGLYPVSPTARNLPFGLRSTQDTAFTLSRALRVLEFPSSLQILRGELLEDLSSAPCFEAKIVRRRLPDAALGDGGL